MMTCPLPCHLSKIGHPSVPTGPDGCGEDSDDDDAPSTTYGGEVGGDKDGEEHEEEDASTPSSEGTWTLLGVSIMYYYRSRTSI